MLHRFSPVAAFTGALCIAVAAHASERTGLSFSDDGYQGEYSQAVPLELSFVDKDGAALDGTTACGAGPCRVEVEMRIADNSAAAFDITAPDVVVDAAGRARVRLTLVNGRHGGAVFIADDEGTAYTLTARFRGAGAPLPDADDVDCADGAAGTDDGRLCPVVATSTVTVLPEVPALSFNQDVVMGIGDTVTLAATLTDPHGDADAAGADIDGPGPKVLEGIPVRFVYDQNDDGNPNFQTELLGEALTNANGVAAFDFFADPAFASAGEYDAGLHAEFPGDDRYTVARTAVRLTLTAGAPDPSKTVIEVDPGTLPADGSSEALIRVRLVDRNNNLLGPGSPVHDVVFKTDLGLLIDDVELDVLDGTYGQQLRVQRKGGTATISVTVDGEDAGAGTLIVVGDEGCTCTQATSSPTFSVLALVLVGLSLLRRRPSGARHV